MTFRAVDPAFRIAVMQRVAARRLRLELAARLVAVAALFVIAVLLAPVAGALAQPLGPVFNDIPAVLCLAGSAALAGYLWLTRRIRLPLV